MVDVAVGDKVRGMRVIEANWSKSVSGEVTEIHEESPVPHVDEAIVIVDDPNDGEVPVRMSGIEEVLE